MTSFGGGKVARLADWTALAGRHVVIWPDHDEPGQAYANDVVAMLAKLSPAATVAIVTPRKHRHRSLTGRLSQSLPAARRPAEALNQRRRW